MKLFKIFSFEQQALQTAKRMALNTGRFCATCSTANRFVEQVQ
jgi:hypothetical protein